MHSRVVLVAFILVAVSVASSQRLSTDTARVCVSVRAGWNIMSNPVLRAPGQDSICTLYPGAYPCCSFTGWPGYFQFVCTLTPGDATFLRFPATQSICVNGEPLTSLTVDIATGWNKIGSVSYPVPVATITTSPPGIISSRFFAYEGMYVGKDTIQPGQGYWVKANQAGTVTLTVPPGNVRGGSNK